MPVESIEQHGERLGTAIGPCTAAVSELLDCCLDHALRASAEHRDDEADTLTAYRNRRATDYWCFATRQAQPASDYVTGFRVVSFGRQHADRRPAIEIAGCFVDSA